MISAPLTTGLPTLPARCHGTVATRVGAVPPKGTATRHGCLRPIAHDGNGKVGVRAAGEELSDAGPNATRRDEANALARPVALGPEADSDGHPGTLAHIDMMSWRSDKSAHADKVAGRLDTMTVAPAPTLTSDVRHLPHRSRFTEPLGTREKGCETRRETMGVVHANHGKA